VLQNFTCACLGFASSITLSSSIFPDLLEAWVNNVNACLVYWLASASKEFDLFHQLKIIILLMILFSMSIVTFVIFATYQVSSSFNLKIFNAVYQGGLCDRSAK
jgi:hypothetical protein